MTIGGLIQTGAHGTGTSIPSMDEFVKEIKMMDANGTILTLNDKDAETFKAAKVSLGSCGALLQVT